MAGSVQPHVVVVGGGFGGLAAVRRLRRENVRITLIDHHNYYLFQPLLYQVATAALNPSDIAMPLRSIVRDQWNVEVLLAHATGIDVASRIVQLKDGDVSYDHLIIATGATHSYFGHDEWEPRAPGLKTLDDALEIRRRVLYAYEAAEREPDAERRRAWMTFVVVGAGPTGVELAGALCEIARYAMARNFRRINPKDARVIVIEGAKHVLPTYVEPLSIKARQQLEGLGAEVDTDARVTGIDASGVTVGDRHIEAKTVLWAAGVRASPLVQSLGAPLDKAGRVEVDSNLAIAVHPEITVIGDVAAFKQDGKLVFGVAPAAMQAGRYAADKIRDALHGRPVKPFRYKDKGSLATIGRKAGIADIHGLRLSGFPAWLAWLLIHVFFLIGFRNRVLVMLEWAWSYLTFQRGARLITGPLPEVERDAGAPGRIEESPSPDDRPIRPEHEAAPPPS